MQEIHIGDVGIVFVITVTKDGVAVDISEATVKQLIFLSPDGTRAEPDAEFYTDGSDGKIKYVVDDADLLHESGYWKIQPYIEIVATIIHGEVEIFEVFSNI